MSTCAERIQSQLASRLLDIEDILHRLNSSDDAVAESASQEQLELPLSSEIVRVLKLELSTGGPADWVECLINNEGIIDRIEYHFADWFDHAECYVTGEDFETLAEFCQAFVPEDLR